MPATISVVGFEFPIDIVVLGILTGLTYAVLGLGLTIVYKSSRVLNFAQGEMGSLAARVLAVLVLNNGWGYWPALLLALLVASASGALIEFGLIRRLSHAPRMVAMVATIGVSQVLFAVSLFIPQVRSQNRLLFPTPFQAHVTIGSLRLNAGHLIILFVVPLITLALTMFFRMTRTGLASRASAENAEMSLLAGVPVGRVSASIWALAGLLAGAAAILIGPTRPVANLGASVALGPVLMVRALAAAMLGGLSNLPVVFVAGVGIGLVESLISWNYQTGNLLDLVLFAIILGSLLFRPALGQRARGGEESSWSLTGALRGIDARALALPFARVARRISLAALLAGAALLPLLIDNTDRVRLSQILIFAMMGMSVVVLTGFAGQVSLGQFAFVGLGAVVGGRMAQLGYPPVMALVYATAAGGLASVLIGLPAVRIRGLFLAVTTLGFALAASTWLFSQQWLVNTGGLRSSLAIPRPVILGIDFQSQLAYFWLCLGAFVFLALVVTHVRRSGLGRSFMAVRDNEPAAATLTVGPRRTKLLAFALAGMIAAFAGYLYGGLLGTFPDLTIFGPIQSLQLLAMVIIGGMTTVTGSLLGALLVVGVPLFLQPSLGNLLGPKVQLLGSGLVLVGILVWLPGGLASGAFRLRDAMLRRLGGNRVREAERAPVVVGRSRLEPAEPLEPDSPDVHPVEASDIVVRFGGNTALAGVSVHARRGEILGLLGPNGAGKTTLFEVLSGHLRPTSGQVLYEGRPIDHLRPEARARRGIGRTFQQAKLFNDMTLIEVVKVALENREPTETLPAVLGLPPSWYAEDRKDRGARELLDLLGLGEFASRTIAELSTGMRRMTELLCVVGLGAKVVLLDEPTAGLAQREVEAFIPLLREVRAHLAATMIVIEHDVPMMMSLAERIYVLAAGEIISEGSPEHVRNDPEVISAYLGSDERTIDRSGRRSAAAAVVATTYEPARARGRTAVRRLDTPVEDVAVSKAANSRRDQP